MSLRAIPNSSVRSGIWRHPSLMTLTALSSARVASPPRGIYSRGSASRWTTTVWSSRQDQPGAKVVLTPGYARYDFTAEASEGTVTGPINVVPAWNGLFPLLDVGPAVDTALHWCNAALAALAGPTTPLLTNALAHHFMTGTPSSAQRAQITARMTGVRDRIAPIPDRFQWTPGFTGAAQTVPGTLTEIGDNFSILHGPNGRASVMIHEAVHFIFTAGGLVIDVPEWSGATINGTTFGVGGGMAYSAMTPTQAIANPSSYAAFAQEIAFLGIDQRFGDARRHE
jgi:hypothetical protein